MNPESKYAVAIKNFLDAIGYRKWGREVGQVMADIPNGSYPDTQLGTLNFKVLADSIDYLAVEHPVSEDPPLDGKRCDACDRSLEHYTDDGKKVTLAGVEISLVGVPEQAIAPYANGRYRICYSCWLKSLGVPAPGV